MSGDPVLLDIDGPIATITLNRPAVGNVVDMAMARGLLRAAIVCDQDASLRCVVLTGAGKLFCGGGDLSVFAEAGQGIPAYLSELAGTLHLAIARLMRMARPLLVLVNGPAAGAGLSLALIGDVVLAADTAHFTAAYGSVGLSPDGGMSWLLPRLVGVRRAQEIIIANRRIGAQEAAAIGLVTRVAADLPAEGLAEARALAAAPTAAVAEARALLLASSHTPLEAQLEAEARAIAAMGGTQDCREGVTAFAGRRTPRFSGA
ncbi:enoyl-CoA hydratase-related protein [Sphingobium sufflavum]|nr:enoyl-CoA hydratase-related protein [Sphingobium sufflavum]MCE7795415.1 enoyl-CoA hydratase-related protein [Sphingobium sufflavum]